MNNAHEIHMQQQQQQLQQQQLQQQQALEQHIDEQQRQLRELMGGSGIVPRGEKSYMPLIAGAVGCGLAAQAVMNKEGMIPALAAAAAGGAVAGGLGHVLGHVPLENTSSKLLVGGFCAGSAATAGITAGYIVGGLFGSDDE